MRPPSLIAMIPARLESGRIPKKNIRYLSGKPLVGHAVDIAREAGCFTEIWVNSDNDVIKSIAREYGAQVHDRPPELAVDLITTKHYTAEFLGKRECDFVVLINTTYPALQPRTIRQFCEFVARGEFDTVLAGVSDQTEVFYNYKPLNFDIGDKLHASLLPSVERVAWALAAWRRETFLSLFEKGKDPTFGGNFTTFHIPTTEALMLGEEEDWNVFEGILRLRNSTHAPQYHTLDPKANPNDLGPTPGSFSSYIDYLNNGLEKMEVLDAAGTTLDSDRAMQLWAEKTYKVQQTGGTVFFAGNGASASMAEHMSADLYKNGEINTTSCSETAYLTSIGNDISFDEIFSFKIRKSFTPNDMLVTISSSGNSPNIVKAIEAAKQKGGLVVTLSGFRKTNKSCHMGDLNFFVPALTYGAVEVAHTGVLHCWVDQFLMLLGKKTRQ